MPKALTVSVKGLDKALRDIKNWEHGKESKLKTIVNKTALKIQSDAKRAAPVDTGRLRASIAMEPYNGGLTMEVGTTLNYAPYIEFGTGPQVDVPSNLLDFAAQFKGKGRGMAPPGALLMWMRSKGIPPELEFVIRRAIAKHGIAAQPFLFPAYEKNRGDYVKAIKDLFRE